jgi:hypothetical protein
MLLFSAQIMAQNSTPGQLKFTQKQLTLSAIVNRLKSAYGYKVSFDADVNMGRQIILPSENISFDDLTMLLQQAGIGVKNIDGNLVIKKLETVTISGTVISSDDKLPVISVTITDNTKKFIGTTDVNGKFLVKIAKGTLVNFNMIGYDTQQKTFDTILQVLVSH